MKKSWKVPIALCGALGACLGCGSLETHNFSEVTDPYAGETVRQNWVEQDRAFVVEVKAALKNEPQHADVVLLGSPTRKQKLGFGYALAVASVGKGYLTFSCEMLYFHDSLASFRITPSTGNEHRLNTTYAEMLGDAFALKPDGTFETFCYRPEVAASPLPGCEANVTMSPAMQFFCSPFSGIRYGTTGGWGGGYLPNRRAYDVVANDIDSATCLRLLYCLNPATRLTAYEHYLRHQAALTPIANQVQARMLQVFKEVPRIQTMRGCNGFEEDSEKVLNSILGAKW